MSSALVQMVGFSAGALTTLAYVPQVMRTWRTRSATDLSLGMLVALSAGVFLWLVYGLAIGAWPIILSNLVSLILALVLVAFKLTCSSTTGPPTASKSGAAPRRPR
jgi:MtN3 and saliva related transmembrane protein